MSGTAACQSSTCPNGHPPSKLECPTCSKLSIKGSFFCSQECFKADWVGARLAFWFFSFSLTSEYAQKTHKVVHDLVRQNMGSPNVATSGGTYNPFPDFPFTGSVRPMYPLSPRRHVPEHIPRPDYAEGGRPRGEYRELGKPARILTLEEQEKARKVCRLSREILDIAASHIRPGISTDEIDEIVHNASIKRNGYPSTLNYNFFPKSLCTSVNEIICHGIPDQRVLQEGDIVNLDVSLYHDGFHGDLNATYPVGKIDEESEKLIKTSRNALDAAIKMCKPGALFRDVGKTIEPIVRANGCSVVRTYVGHGINELYHGAPNIPHYAKNKAVGTMKPGMVFTIEPMVNLGSNWGEVHWPDDWTAATVDGKRSAQFEETLLITETGVEVLTAGRDFA